MDPFSLAFMGMTGAQGALSIFGLGQQNKALKRATRLKQAALRQNADMVMKEAGFEINRLDDQIDAVHGAQTNFYAGGNLDPASGSPAIVQALTAAQGETDKMLLAAKGQSARADMFQQISDLESRLDDARKGFALGVGTQLLSTATQWLGLQRQNMQRTNGSAFGSFGLFNQQPENTFAAARRINGYNGWGV